MLKIEPVWLSDYDRANIGAILGGTGTWFSCLLLRLIARSDAQNRRRFRLGWPEHVEVVEQYLGLVSTA